MFLWNMNLVAGIPAIDEPRRHLLEAMADFFQILDHPALNQKMVAETTGAIFKAMKASFAAEEQFLQSRPEAERERHLCAHADFLAGYVELCKKLVPKIKTLKQAQQVGLEIYRMIDLGLYKHICDEALGYKHMRSHPVKQTA